MEKLSKAYWDDIKERYPEAYKHWLNWLKNYQKEVGWPLLFGHDSDWQDVNGKNFPLRKFEEIPFEMQNGIIARYELELYNNREGQGKQEYEKLATKYHHNISLIYRDLEAALFNSRNYLKN